MLGEGLSSGVRDVRQANKEKKPTIPGKGLSSGFRYFCRLAEVAVFRIVQP